MDTKLGIVVRVLNSFQAPLILYVSFKRQDSSNDKTNQRAGNTNPKRNAKEE